MANGAERKAKQRLKRKRKQQELRKRNSLSIFRLVADADTPIQCYINEGWEEEPQTSIFVLRQVPGRGHAMASFLIDFGVLGLKDAWGHISITPLEFRENILDRASKEVPLVSCDVELARKLIAGAIRIRHDNGFRQVHRLDRWLALVGDIGNWHTADISKFSPEFAESFAYLRRNLIGTSPEEFMRPTDLHFIIRDEESPLFDEEDEVDDEVVQEALERSRRCRQCDVRVVPGTGRDAASETR